MAKELWVSKRDQTLAGKQVHKGQIIRPSGQVNDHLIFGDSTRWAYRFDGRESECERCGSDGCDAAFVSLGLLDRHRALTHGPERDARMRERAQIAQAMARAEERGEMIGGVPVETVKGGPGGPVPYIGPALGR